MAAKKMRPSDPIMIRIFKQESELEVWKQDRTGRYAYLRPIQSAAGPASLDPKKLKATVKRQRDFTALRHGR